MRIISCLPYSNYLYDCASYDVLNKSVIGELVHTTVFEHYMFMFFTIEG